jgi:hypothetical protein
MTPEYRELITQDGATPVSKLSGAFLKPPVADAPSFAYYEVDRWWCVRDRAVGDAKRMSDDPRRSGNGRPDQ